MEVKIKVQRAELVQENNWPELDEQELDLSSHPSWRSVALQYRSVRRQLEAAGAAERKLRAILDRLATSRRTFGCGVEVLKSFRRGVVDYSQIPELRGVNLEKFRKAPVQVMNINCSEPGPDLVGDSFREGVRV